MFHTVFAGNTGYGKSVAAERLALEPTAHWRYCSIVLDFGQGWRKMLNAPGLSGRGASAGHVEIYQLQPGVMLIGLYLDNGALTADKNVLGDPDWNTVFNRHEEDEIVRRLQELNLPARSLVGMHLGSLTAVERQALAVYRSRNVDLIGWYERLHEMYRKMDPRTTTDRTSLEGVLLRLEPFSRGEMAAFANARCTARATT
jgi:hypothetical protein